jgi:hypothetical protein
MQLELDRKEASALDGALRRYLDLQMTEIAHTEQHDVRVALKTDYEQVEKLERRLKNLLETPG